MAATAAEIRERDLLTRLAAGTAGVVGAAFLRRLVRRGRRRARRRGRVRRRADRAAPGLRGHDRQRLPGRHGAARGPRVRARRHAVRARLRARPAARPPRRARCATRPTTFLRAHGLDGYLAIALRGADGRPIGHIGVISTRALDPAPSELQALQVFAARAGAELERRRHERALRARARRGRRLPRPRRARRRRGAPPDRARPARRRAAAARRARPGAGPRAARARATTRAQAIERLHRRARAGRASPAASCASWPAGLHPVGLERGLRGRARRARAAVAAAARGRQRCPSARLPPSSRPRSGSSSPRRSRTRSSTRRRDARDGRDPSSTGARSSPTVADDGAGGACRTRGTGLQGLARARRVARRRACTSRARSAPARR